MFRLEVTVERFSDYFFGFGTFAMAKSSENLRVAFAVENGFDDEHAGQASDIREYVGEFDIHQLEIFLNVLNMSGAMADETIAMTDVGAERTDLSGGNERTTEQTVGVELLYPLTIENIRFLAGNILDMTGIDNQDFKAAFFENFESRYPINASGFHCDSIDLSGFKPIGESVKIRGEGWELTDGSFLATFGNSGPNFFIADIETGGIEIKLFETIEFDDLAGSFYVAFLGHDRILLIEWNEIGSDQTQS